MEEPKFQMPAEDKKRLKQMKSDLESKLDSRISVVKADEKNFEKRLKILGLKSKEPSLSQSQIAERVGFTHQTVGKILAKYAEGGLDSIIPKKRGRKPDAAARSQRLQKLNSLFECNPELRKEELRVLLAQVLNQPIAESTFRRYLNEAGIEPKR